MAAGLFIPSSPSDYSATSFAASCVAPTVFDVSLPIPRIVLPHYASKRTARSAVAIFVEVFMARSPKSDVQSAVAPRLMTGQIVRDL